MLTRGSIRSFITSALEVVNDVAKQQFSVKMLDEKAYIGYETQGKEIKYVTTQVPEVFQGKGVGKLLAKHAFTYAKTNNLNVTINCHFLADYYEKYKNDYKSLKVTIDLKDEE